MHAVYLHQGCRESRLHLGRGSCLAFRQATCAYAYAGEAISLRIWAGCIAALAGGVLMTLSHSGPDAASAFSGLAAGDGLLIGAALLWSIQVRALVRVTQLLLKRSPHMVVWDEVCSAARERSKPVQNGSISLRL